MHTFRKFFLTTLETAQSLRPEGRWGYYLFPDCYNLAGERHCSEKQTNLNDRSVNAEKTYLEFRVYSENIFKDLSHRCRIMWLFNQSSALFPSTYLENGDNQTRNENEVFGTLMEAMRVRRKVGASTHEKPIYLYSRVRYRHTDDWYIEVKGPKE